MRRPLPLFLRSGDHQRFCSEILNVNLTDPGLKWDNADNSSSKSNMKMKNGSMINGGDSCGRQQHGKAVGPQQLPKILSLDEIPVSVETII